MITPQDIIRQVEALSGHALNKDEGVHHGAADAALTGATVSWMASPEAIRAAGEAGHQLLLVHESLYFPYDVFIAGESDSYGFRFAVESGVSVIETSHEDSENAGLRRFTQKMAEAFPGLDWRFHEDLCVWRTA